MRNFFVVLMSLLSLSVAAQDQMTYSYDAAGNRISRMIILTRTKAKSASLSLSDILDNHPVQIISNSSTGHLLVEVLGKKDGSAFVSIYNSSGMQVFRKEMKNERMDVDFSSIPNGIFILALEMNGCKTSWKIVKK